MNLLTPLAHYANETLNGETSARKAEAQAACLATCSRRSLFVQLGALVALTACASETNPVAPDDDAITFTSGAVTLRLDRLDALRAIGTAFVISQRSVIVIRVADRDYRAFTNVCTHSGCGIYLFQSPRMICQCHGSEYDVDGLNVAGPAPLPLTRYPAQLNAPENTLRITVPV